MMYIICKTRLQNTKRREDKNQVFIKSWLTCLGLGQCMLRLGSMGNLYCSKIKLRTLSVKINLDHFFRVTLTKIHSIKMNHIWTQSSYSTPYQAHLKKTNVWLSQKGVKWGEIARGHFSKITETACLPATELGKDKSQYGGYITRHWNWMNSYWMFWGSQWAVSVILKKLPFAISLHFSPFWQKHPSDFSDVLHKENYSLCA